MLVTPLPMPTLVTSLASVVAGAILVGVCAVGSVVVGVRAAASVVVCADETTGDSSAKAAIISTLSRIFFI
jgi:hypothetical protein